MGLKVRLLHLVEGVIFVSCIGGHQAEVTGWRGRAAGGARPAQAAAAARSLAWSCPPLSTSGQQPRVPPFGRERLPLRVEQNGDNRATWHSVFGQEPPKLRPADLIS